jgi:Tol biopolymer transport system component
MKNLVLFCLVGVLVYTIPQIAYCQDIERRFNKGLMLEEGSGNLQAAIEVFMDIADDAEASRSMKAKALLHVGLCHEKLGNQKARNTYEKILAQYNDQPEVIDQVKYRLKKLKTATDKKTVKGIVVEEMPFIDEDVYGVSPDGKYVNLIDWYNIQLQVKEILTGEIIWKSPRGTWKEPMQFPDISIWSPDSKKIAYYWFNGSNTELHIASIDGSRDKVLEISNHTYWPTGWTPDGRYLICIVPDETSHPDHSKHFLGKYEINTGEFTRLLTYDDLQIDPKMDVSPDSKWLLYSMKTKEAEVPFDIYLLSLDGEINQKLISSQGDDRSPVWNIDGNLILFNSNRYGSNDLWQVKLDGELKPGPEMIVRPNLGNEIFLLRIDQDENLYYRFADFRVDMHFLNLKDFSEEPSASKKLSDFDIQFNINPAMSRDGNSVAYFRWNLERDDILGNPLNLSIYNAKTGELKEIDTGLYGNTRNHWHLISWSPDGSKVLLKAITQEDYTAGSCIYDLNSGKFELLKGVKNSSRHNDFGEIGHMHMFSGDGKSIYYLNQDRKGITKIDLATKEETAVFNSVDPMRCFRVSDDGEKIAFGKFFTNRNQIYVYDLNTKEVRTVLTLAEGILPELVSFDNEDQFIYFGAGDFINLKYLMRVPTSGGEPEILFDFKKAFPGEVVQRVVYNDTTMNMAFELGKGKGSQLMKVSGLFD